MTIFCKNTKRKHVPKRTFQKLFHLCREPRVTEQVFIVFRSFLATDWKFSLEICVAVKANSSAIRLCNSHFSVTCVHGGVDQKPGGKKKDRNAQFFWRFPL